MNIMVKIESIISIVCTLAEPISSFSLDEDILVCEQLLAIHLLLAVFSFFILQDKMQLVQRQIFFEGLLDDT